MSLTEKHAAFCWTADVILIPFVGLWFLFGGVLVAVLGRVTINGGLVTWETDPLKMAAVIAGAELIGMLSIGYGLLRYYFGRRLERVVDTLNDKHE